MLNKRSIAKKVTMIAVSILMLMNTFSTSITGIGIILANEYEEATTEYIEVVTEYEEIEVIPEYIPIYEDYSEPQVNDYTSPDETFEEVATEYTIVDTVEVSEISDTEIQIAPTSEQVRLIDIFADELLARAVARHLLQENPDENIGIFDLIYLSDLEYITVLTAENNGIFSLVGIEYLTNLRVLNLNGNQITNTNPLMALTNLEVLRLSNNQISDFNQIMNMVLNLPNLNIFNYENNLAVGSGRTLYPRIEFPIQRELATTYNPETGSWGSDWGSVTVSANTILIPEGEVCFFACSWYVRVDNTLATVAPEWVNAITGRGIITSTNNIRRGPSQNYQYSPSGALHLNSGQEVAIVGQVGEWFAIALVRAVEQSSNSFGTHFWIHANDITITVEADWNGHEVIPPTPPTEPPTTPTPPVPPRPPVPPTEPPIPPVTVDPVSIQAMYNFLNANTPEYRVIIPVDAITETQILIAVNEVLNEIEGLSNVVTVNLIRQENTTVIDYQINNITVELSVNPSYTFENQTIYFRYADVEEDNGDNGNGETETTRPSEPEETIPSEPIPTTPEDCETEDNNNDTENNGGTGNNNNANNNRPNLPQTGATFIHTGIAGVGLSALGAIVAFIKDKK